jgi:hypothetical protein
MGNFKYFDCAFLWFFGLPSMIYLWDLPSTVFVSRSALYARRLLVWDV